MNVFNQSGTGLCNRPARLRSACLMIALALLGSAANAQQDISRSDLEELLRVKVRTVQHMALNPLLVRAVRQQNASGLTLEEIGRRDKAWSATKELTPFKLSLQTSPAGRFLSEQVNRGASFNEAFLTDIQGAHVSAFPATSDYWQGDEGKWSNAFNDGEGRIYIGELALDESTNTVAAQVSAPVLDRGNTIGVLVVGVTISYLQTKLQ
jgi:hypothetical protein